MSDVEIGRPEQLDILIVGGAGSMGRWAVRSVARLGSASRLVIADLDVERAERLADEVGAPCEALKLDATDERALRDAFSDCDVVLNTMGPFSLFGSTILRAAVERGCDYLDIDDDWESSLEALELDELARSRRLRVLKGMGSSPGTSNLCAALAASKLDSVDELFTGWKLGAAVVEPEDAYPAPADGATAAVEHWLLQCSGTIRVWNDGAEQEVRPLQRVTLALPGFGPTSVYTIGHPEAVTLPRTVRGLRRCVNVMSGPEWLFDYLRKVAADHDAGRVDLEEGARLLSAAPRPAGPVPRDPLPGNWALARGQRGGERIAVLVHPTAHPRGRMGGATGVPLAIGVELLRQGRIDGVGVLFPEAAIDPHDYFAAYAPLTDPAHESAHGLVASAEAPWLD